MASWNPDDIRDPWDEPDCDWDAPGCCLDGSCPLCRRVEVVEVPAPVPEDERVRLVPEAA